MFPILFVLISMSAFGISNACWKPLMDRFTPSFVLFRRSLFTVIGMGIVLFVAVDNDVPNAINSEGIKSISSLTRALSSILLSLAGLYLLILSMKFAPAFLTGLVISISSILSAIFGCLILNETCSKKLMLAFAIAVTGVILLDRPVTKATQHSHKNPIKGTLIAICAATCWAIANLGFKTSIPELGIYSFCFLQEATVLLISGSAVLINRSYYPPTNKDHLLIFFIAALTIVGVIFNNLGMNQLPLNLFSLLVLAQPLTTFLVAYGWLKERPTKVQWVGSALLLTGVYLGIA